MTARHYHTTTTKHEARNVEEHSTQGSNDHWWPRPSWDGGEANDLGCVCLYICDERTESVVLIGQAWGYGERIHGDDAQVEAGGAVITWQSAHISLYLIMFCSYGWFTIDINYRYADDQGCVKIVLDTLSLYSNSFFFEKYTSVRWSKYCDWFHNFLRFCWFILCLLFFVGQFLVWK